MLFRKVESTITKVVKVKDRSSIGDRNYFYNIYYKIKEDKGIGL